MKRALILFSLLLLLIEGLHAQENYVRDSLLLRLKDHPHNQTRLEILNALAQVTQENIDQSRQYNQQLLEEAEQQNNNRYICEAYFSEVVFAYNTYDQNKLQEMTDLLIPLARKEKLYNLMFRAWRCKLDFLLLTQDLERNEREARKMLAEAQRLNNEIGILEAYQSIANLYRLTHRQQEAILVLENANSLAEKIKDVDYLTNIWQQLLFLYSETNDRPKWLAMLKKSEQFINQLPAEQRRLQHLILLIIYSNYTTFYTQGGDLERAEYYLHRGEEYLLDASAPPYKIYFGKASAEYYVQAEQYEKALTQIDYTLETMAQISMAEDYYRLVAMKAMLMNRLNRPQEAAQLFKQTIAVKDSIHIEIINKQYEQIKKYFKADQLVLEEAEYRYRMQIYMLILLGIGLSVIAGFVVYVLRTHRTLQKAEEQMRGMNHQMEVINEAKNRFLSNISTTIREPLNIVVEGSLQLANRQISDPTEQQRLSVDIRQKAAKLLTVINDILDLSRLEAGMMKFETIDAEATSLFLDAVCSQQNERNMIEVVPEYPENTLYMLRLDGNRLMQLFKSLLTAETAQVTAYLRELGEDKLQLCIVGSILTREQPEQDIIIRNEINRMLMEQFGGSYTIREQQIILTLPFTEKITLSEE